MSEREPASHLLMSSARIDRAITRIAFQIYEDTRGSDRLVIFGIDERGFRLASILAEKLTDICHSSISAYPLDIKKRTRIHPGLARDETDGADETGEIDETGKAGETGDSGETEQQNNYLEYLEGRPSVGGKKVVIVDDVMYSGRTMYEALRTVTKQENPEEIKLVTLIDRGHRRYPVTVKYAGLFCPTKLQEHVRCDFGDDGQPEGVWLLSSPESSK